MSDTPTTSIDRELNKILANLCDADCGINGDPADGFGIYHNCEIPESITAIKELIAQAHETRDGWCCACEADIAFATSWIQEEPEFKELIAKREALARLGMVEYYDQCTDNKSMNWKGLFSGNRDAARVPCDCLDGWDMMIAHPPCTYLANSGVSWLYKQEGRWDKMREGALFFAALLNAPIPLIAVENPIMHKYSVEIIGRRQDQVIQPYEFGHLERKATCLWLKGLPLLKPTNDVKEEMLKLPKNVQQRLHYLPPSKDRWKIRSTTYQGIADAMAEQWGVSAGLNPS